MTAKKSKKMTALGWAQLVLTAAPVASGIVTGIQGNAIWSCASIVLAVIGLATGRVVLKGYGKSEDSQAAARAVACLMMLGLGTGVLAVILAPTSRPTTAVLALILAWAFASMIDSALFIRVKRDPLGGRMALRRFAKLGGISAIAMAILAGAFGVLAKGAQLLLAHLWISGASLMCTAIGMAAGAVVLASSRPVVGGMALFGTGWAVAGFGSAIAEDRLPVSGIMTVMVGIAMMGTGVAFWRWSSERVGIVLLVDTGLVTVTALSWGVGRLGTSVWLWAPGVLALGLAAYLFLAKVKSPQFRRENSAPTWSDTRFIAVSCATGAIGLALVGVTIMFSFFGARGSTIAAGGSAVGWFLVSTITIVAFIKRPRLSIRDLATLEKATHSIDA